MSIFLAITKCTFDVITPSILFPKANQQNSRPNFQPNSCRWGFDQPEDHQDTI